MYMYAIHVHPQYHTFRGGGKLILSFLATKCFCTYLLTVFGASLGSVRGPVVVWASSTDNPAPTKQARTSVFIENVERPKEVDFKANRQQNSSNSPSVLSV